MKKWVLLAISGASLIILGTLVISRWFERNPVAGGIVAAMLFFLLLVTLAMGMFYLGSTWTERQVRLGASIATTAQQIDNLADERKTAALAQFARHMIQVGQKQVPPPPLTLPPYANETEAIDWLPPLSAINDPSDDTNPHP
jgi:uncharacterized iron-regulated membrane protein